MTGNTKSRHHCPEQTDHPSAARRRELLVVAEGLHVLNQRVCAAVTDQDAAALLALARQHLAGGAQALAVNLGPGRAMARLTPWVTETLRRELTVPLFLSANGLAFPELLRRHGTHLTINAVTADPAALPQALATANECGSALVVLLVRPGLTPTGSADRLAVASEVIAQALRHGFPLRRLYLDPLLALRPDPLAWRISRGMPDLGPVAETISQLRQLATGLRTIVALGNCATGDNRSSDLQAKILTVLVDAGLDAVLLNGRDSALMAACRELARDGAMAGPVSRAA